MTSWVAFGIACVELLEGIVEQLKQSQWYQAGVTAQQAADKAAADKLQAHYDEIAAAPLSADDAIAGLRARAGPAPAAGDNH